MRIISIGDLHGLTVWKQINPKKYSKIIFIGDFCDSFTHTDEQIIANLLDIIEFKKKYPKKVILLLGNHDVQYFIKDSPGCSGYRKSMQFSLNSIFSDNAKLFTYAYQKRNVLWTHAGVSSGWMQSSIEHLKSVGYPKICLATAINRIANTHHTWILHKVGIESGGIYKYGGIMWARNVENDMLHEMHQIYGHTHTSSVYAVEKENTSATNIDCLCQKGISQALEIEIGKTPIRAREDLKHKIVELEYFGSTLNFD